MKNLPLSSSPGRGHDMAVRSGSAEPLTNNLHHSEHVAVILHAVYLLAVLVVAHTGLSRMDQTKKD